MYHFHKKNVFIKINPLLILKKRSSIVLFCAIMALCSCDSIKKIATTTDTPAPTVHFIKNETLANVLAQAKVQKKLVFVDVYTTWCLPCKIMDEEVFSKKQMIDYLNDNFISYKVDAEKGTGGAVALMYEVEAYPTMLFLDEKGTVLQKREGAGTVEDVRNMGERAKAQANK
jgi:thiol:disulfide interchange protein